MTHFDWDDAYDNVGHIADAASWPKKWAAEAEAFRAAHPPQELAYGPGARQRLDLFLPAAPAKGLCVFVHGGYWIRFDKSVWSHLAQGALEHGWAMAIPGYTLTPEARIRDITAEIAAAVDLAAGRVDGPIRLAGHSAGGHLVTRMACAGGPLGGAARVRLAHVLSISGLHDLAPLMNTKMNDTLGLDAEEACAESAVHYDALPGVSVTAWVGGAERPEFLRQSRLLADAWPSCRLKVVPGQHHFDVVEGLAAPDDPICAELIGV